MKTFTIFKKPFWLFISGLKFKWCDTMTQIHSDNINSWNVQGQSYSVHDRGWSDHVSSLEFGLSLNCWLWHWKNWGLSSTASHPLFHVCGPCDQWDQESRSRWQCWLDGVPVTNVTVWVVWTAGIDGLQVWRRLAIWDKGVGRIAVSQPPPWLTDISLLCGHPSMHVSVPHFINTPVR